MRLRLTLRKQRVDCCVGLNYAYYLSGAIYGWIEKSSPVYASFLHDHGYQLENTVRKFKHFCFSQLQVQDRQIDKSRGTMKIISPAVDWYISMPIEEALQHLIIGIFEKEELYIDREYNRFTVEQVEALPEPVWERGMKFRMLSPTTVSLPDTKDGRLGDHYLFHDDPRLSECLRKNILNKYKSLHGMPPADDSFDCTLDEKFIWDAKGRGRKISRLITIKEGKEDETKVRGFMCPVTIEGNPELIKLAYESGLGEKNSLGFGMIEHVANGKCQDSKMAE